MVKALSDEAPCLIGGLTEARLLIGCAGARRSPKPKPSRFPYIDSGHDNIDLCCAIGGKCVVEMGGKCFRVRGGHVCVIPPRLRHADTFVERGSPYTLLWFTLDKERVGAHLTRYSRRTGFNIVYRVRCDAAVSAPRLTGDVLRAIAEGRVRKGSLARFKAHLLELCSLVLNQCVQTDAASQIDWRGSIITEVMEHIRTHYPNSPSLSEISSHVRLSPNYLCSLFRKHTGRTVLTHLNSIRMKKAEELLIGSRSSIKEIAKETGFKSANYFSRTFRRVHGASPSVFRERHAGGHS